VRYASLSYWDSYQAAEAAARAREPAKDNVLASRAEGELRARVFEVRRINE